MFHADIAITARRRADLQEYIEKHLLDATRVFCCANYSASCKPSAVAAGLSFTEGEMPHVGHHYDLSDDEGREYRVVVVGQERGRGVPRATMDDWWVRCMQVARREIVPDPTIRGVTFALMELFGLSRDAWGTYTGESIPIDGKLVHVFDCFGLTNSTLCSATLQGQQTKGRATREMKTKCVPHLRAMLNILQPTILLLLGKSARDTAAAALNIRLEQNKPVQVAIDGVNCQVLPFAHPLNRQSPWRTPNSPYLRETVLPALRGDGSIQLRPRMPLVVQKRRRRGPMAGGPIVVAASSATVPRMTDEDHVMLVGCLRWADTEPFLDTFQKLGVATSRWNFNFKDKHEAALRQCPHLYIYAPAPRKAIIYCLRVEEWSTTPSGQLVDGTDVLTSFRVVCLHDLTQQPIPPNACQNQEGKDVTGSNLLNAFGLWTLKKGSPISLPCRAHKV